LYRLKPRADSRDADCDDTGEERQAGVLFDAIVRAVSAGAKKS
jgi:hypothetical protein